MAGVHGCPRHEPPPWLPPHHCPCAHPWRGANCPWKSGRRPLCTHQKLGAFGKPWLTGNGFHTEGLASPVLANAVFPLLTRTVQVLVSLEVLVDGRSCGPRGAHAELKSGVTGHPEGWSPPHERQATSSQCGEMSSELGSPLSEGIAGPRTHNSLKSGILAPDKRIRPLRHARVVQSSYMAPLFQPISEAYSPCMVNKHLIYKKYVEAHGNCCLQKL